jgi:hypothetical protein
VAKHAHTSVLIGTLIFLALALGGVFLWARLAALGALTIACLSYGVHRHQHKRKVPVPRLAAWGLLFAILPVLYCVPVPLAWIELVQRTTAQVYSDLAAATGATDRLVPLSVDASSSLEASLRFSLYLLAFLLASFAARRRRSVTLLLDSLCGLGVSLSLIALLHAASSADAILFLYRPSIGLHRAFSTFANPNHLGAFLCMTAGLTFGRYLSEENEARSRVLAAAFLVQGLHLLLIPSGNAVMAAPLIVIIGVLFKVLLTGRHALGASIRSRRAFAIATITAALALTNLVLHDIILPELASTKVDILPKLASMLPLAPAFGAGPDAFLGFAARFGPPAGQVFAAPENIVLQMAFDFGTPLALLAFLVIGRLVVRTMSNRSRMRAQTGLLTAVLIFGVHELVDFGLFVPAVGVLFFTLLGTLAVAPEDRDSPTATRSFRLRPWVFVTLVLLVSGLAAGATALSTQVIDRGHLIAWTPKKQPQPQATLDEALARGRWYPLDSRVWMRAAIQLQKRGEEAAADRLFAYTNLIAPGRRDVFRFWLPLLRERDPDRHEALLRQLVDGFGTLPGALDAPAVVPQEMMAVVRLAIYPRRMFRDRIALIPAYLSEVSRQPAERRETFAYMVLYDYPAHPDVLEDLEQFAFEHKLDGLRQDILDSLVKHAPDHATTHRVRARHLLAQGTPAEALPSARAALARRGAPVFQDYALLVDVCIRAAEYDDARDTIDAIGRTFEGKSVNAAKMLIRLHLEQKNYVLALTVAEHLLAEVPEDHQALALLALAQVQAGKLLEAARSYDSLFQRTGEHKYRTTAAGIKERHADEKRRSTLRALP